MVHIAQRFEFEFFHAVPQLWQRRTEVDVMPEFRERTAFQPGLVHVNFPGMDIDDRGLLFIFIDPFDDRFCQQQGIESEIPAPRKTLPFDTETELVRRHEAST